MNYQKDSEPAGEQMTLFSQAGSLSLANPTAQQENEKVKKMSATCGRKCLEQFGKFPRAGLWAKTFAGLLIGMEGWYSTRCRLTWKLQATKYSRFYFLLQVSTPRIDETGYSLVPTTRANDAEKRGNVSADPRNGLPGMAMAGLLPTPDASLATGGKVTNPEKVSITGKTVDGKKRQISLSDYVKRSLLPTPQAAESDKITGLENQNSLTKHFRNQTGATSQLSPHFVLEMMGFPACYTKKPFKTNIQWIEI